MTKPIEGTTSDEATPVLIVTAISPDAALHGVSPIRGAKVLLWTTSPVRLVDEVDIVGQTWRVLTTTGAEYRCRTLLPNTFWPLLQELGRELARRHSQESP